MSARRANTADPAFEQALRAAAAFEILARRRSRFGADKPHRQWSALRYFARVNERAATLSAFAANHGITAQAAASAVSSLVNAGELKRAPSATDARSSIIRLTAEGRRSLRRDPARVFAETIDHTFDDDQIESFGGLIARLLRGLVDMSPAARARRTVDAPESAPTSSAAAAETASPAEAFVVLLDETADRFARLAAKPPLGRGAWAALRHLADAERADATVIGVAQAHLINRSTASREVSNLIDLQLVRHAAAPEGAHHRAQSLALTAKGRATLVDDPLNAAAEIIDATFTAKERRAFLKLSNKLAALEAGEDDAAS